MATSFVPTIKCSDCGVPMEIMAMADHQCNTDTQHLYEIASSTAAMSKVNKSPPKMMMTGSGKSLRDLAFPSQLRNVVQEAMNKPRPTMTIDINRSNRPYTSSQLPRTASSHGSDSQHSSSPTTPEDNEPLASLSTRKETLTVPEKPYSKNLDPLPTPSDTLSGVPKSPLRYFMPVLSPNHESPVNPNLVPANPLPNGANVLKRMNTLTPGPFSLRGKAASGKGLPPPPPTPSQELHSKREIFNDDNDDAIDMTSEVANLDMENSKKSAPSSGTTGTQHSRDLSQSSDEGFGLPASRSSRHFRSSNLADRAKTFPDRISSSLPSTPKSSSPVNTKNVEARRPSAFSAASQNEQVPVLPQLNSQKNIATVARNSTTLRGREAPFPGSTKPFSRSSRSGSEFSDQNEPLPTASLPYLMDRQPERKASISTSADQPQQVDRLRPMQEITGPQTVFAQSVLHAPPSPGYSQSEFSRPALTPRSHTFPNTISGPRKPSERRPSKERAVCRVCNERIEGEKPVFSSDGKLSGKFHKKCFRCACCKLPFYPAAAAGQVAKKEQPSTFYVFENRPYCPYDYHVRNNSLCPQCGQGIEGQCREVGFDVGRPKRYHVNCFCCTIPNCHEDFETGYHELPEFRDGRTVFRRFCVKHVPSSVKSTRRFTRMMPLG